MAYDIQWTPRAVKDLLELPKSVQERILSAVDPLAEDPRPPGARKLVDQDGRYRIRVGDFRLFYEIYDGVLVIVVVKVADRKDAYRR
ncbi:MAG: type II toxin-antitoxin system RelE family toxin [Actinomycetota bacterium]